MHYLKSSLINQVDSFSLEEKKEERQTSMPAAPPAASTDATPDYDQIRRYNPVMTWWRRSKATTGAAQMNGQSG
jgi:hypothetical protein